MTPIGGYFELELTAGTTVFHSQARLALKSGRACVRCLVECESPQKVWVPYYTCDALTEPLEATGTPFVFYPINQSFEIEGSRPELEDDERLVYVNYFGINTSYAKSLERHYGQRLWVDNTHAFFERPERTESFHFNSARKFFGTPDGGFLYAPASVSLPAENTWRRNTNYRFEHLMLRHLGKVEEGYPFFQENESRNGGEIARISELSDTILKQIDYPKIATQRRENYRYLHETLSSTNLLPERVTEFNDEEVPFCYPYLPRNAMDKRYFWDRKLYIPQLWTDCIQRPASGFEWERQLSRGLLPLPIDHRYGEVEMSRLIDAVENYGK